jgi:hypothetical protein
MKVSLVLSFQRKNFFFEKKKQKTFNPSGQRPRRGAPEDVDVLTPFLTRARDRVILPWNKQGSP